MKDFIITKIFKPIYMFSIVGTYILCIMAGVSFFIVDDMQMAFVCALFNSLSTPYVVKVLVRYIQQL